MSKSDNTVFRSININGPEKKKYPPNIIRNQKYQITTFLFIVLFNQFKQFFNVYFFFISASQCFNSYRIGPIYTSFGPWAFVLILTLGKEAIDDFTRYRRDKEANSEKYSIVKPDGIKIVSSSELKVGDLVLLEKNRRIPADLVVLKTFENDGQCFIRTDQLDGETDWKLRNAVSSIQSQDLAFLFKRNKVKDSEYSIISNENSDDENLNDRDDKSFKESDRDENDENENDEKLKPQNITNHDISEETQSEKSTDENNETNSIPLDSEEEVFKDFEDVKENNNEMKNELNNEKISHDGKNEKISDKSDGENAYQDDFGENLELRENSDDEYKSKKFKGGGESPENLSNSEIMKEIAMSVKEDGINQSSTYSVSENDLKSLFDQKIKIFADKPHKDIYNFIGRISISKDGLELQTPLSLDNVVWMNTVLATQGILGAVIYTGIETRAMMNTALPRNKFGLIESEINFYSILLCASSIFVACLFLFFSGISSRFDITLIRFIIIFSSVIPISLKVTIDVARLFFYSNWMMNDSDIPGCIVRNSNIPEELGRVTYLLSDKTGTLTRNEMEMRKVHIGTVCFTTEINEEVVEIIRKKLQVKSKKTRDMGTKVFNLVCALALCHNVTPVVEDGVRFYQASSPDEVALVKWCEKIGVILEKRTKEQIVIRILDNTLKKFKILYIFPFTSDTKRMGAILKDLETSEILFILKGADMIMKKIVEKNDWLDEEVDNMAREGLRTLVIGMKNLNEEEFNNFEQEFKEANNALNERCEKTQNVICKLENNLKLLGLTGVEDKLQENVEQSLENLRNAGVKIWMLTGDKIETAISISISSRLFMKRSLYEIISVSSREEAWEKLSSLKEKMINYIIIDGFSLQIMIDNFMREFILFAATLDAVVCCRCTPTQKALVARNLRMLTPHRVACIGDGGNDVSMITEANVGIGIVGKEGNQASLAADFSILKFSDVTTLFFWHGRNCYRGTAKLIQFIIHRGTIISVMQGIFSAIFGFSPIALYQGFLMMGYVCLYTMCPMWCIILDRDVSKPNVFKFPELYKEMVQNKILSARSFVAWNLISFYQGSVIMILTFYQFEHELMSLITITFSCLIINELLVVLLMVSSINKWMILSQVFSVLMYILSFLILSDSLRLPENFLSFIFNVFLISIIAIFFSLFELFYLKIIRPPSYSKIANATAKLQIE